MPFLDSLEEEHRRWIQYGIMLLKVLSDFKVTFVEDGKDYDGVLDGIFGEPVYRWKRKEVVE